LWTELGRNDVHDVKKDEKRTANFSLITAVATVIVAITLDTLRQTHIVGTLEISRHSAR